MSRTLTDDEIATAETIFREYLRARALKYTRERQLMLHEVLHNPDHFEAEQLLINLRQSGRRIAKATIYRTLPLLVGCGIIRQVRFGDNLARYEHTFGQSPHDHMVCRRCHRIIEFASDDLIRLRNALAAPHRFHALSHRFEISGLCEACAKAPPPQERSNIPSKPNNES